MSAPYGWYYEGGTVQDDDGNAWELLQRAVEQAIDDDRLHALMFGPMRELSIDELLDSDDIVSLCDDDEYDDGLQAWRIADLVSERAGERIEDNRARLTYSDDDAQKSLVELLARYADRELAAPHVVEWASDNIEIEMTRYCDGSAPFPIVYVEGEWIFGGGEIDREDVGAIITYTTEPSPETGHVGWCWWALGKMGDAPKLEQARLAAEAVIASVIK